jgi:hypothetical protein
MCFCFLLGVVFPLDVTCPTWSLILHVEVRVLRNIRSSKLFRVGGIQCVCIGVDLNAALVADAEASCFKTLLQLPFIRALEDVITFSKGFNTCY